MRRTSLVIVSLLLCIALSVPALGRRPSWTLFSVQRTTRQHFPMFRQAAGMKLAYRRSTAAAS